MTSRKDAGRSSSPPAPPPLRVVDARKYAREQGAARLDGETFCLADALREWGIDDLLQDFNMAPDWRFRLCPSADTDEELIDVLETGVSCFVPESYAEDVFAACGEDGIDFVTRSEWNDLPKPRIAFKSDWGRPGTMMADHTKLHLLRSFDELYKSDDVLNLQMFHREGADNPGIPCLPLKLQWPLPAVFGHQPDHVLEASTNEKKPEVAANGESPTQCSEEKQHDGVVTASTGAKKPNAETEEDGDVGLHGGQTSIQVGNGVVVDNATRLSKQGALTWWHLDDGGEFVYQVALPLGKHGSSTKLIGPTGKPVTKMFIFVPLDSYDLINHDDWNDAVASHTVAALDIFRLPHHHLPNPGAKEAQESHSKRGLPTLWVALLEAGGRPLLSTPNVPHLVLTVQDCVMVEQRRLGKLFVDEMAYFMERARKWAEPPVMYNYLVQDIKREEHVVAELIPALLEQASSAAIHSTEHDPAVEDEKGCDASAKQREFCARRALASLESIARHHRHFAISRAALAQLEEYIVTLRTSLVASDGRPLAPCSVESSPVGSKSKGGTSAAVSLPRRDEATARAEPWSVDARQATIQSTIEHLRQGVVGVSMLQPGSYAARVRVRCQPIFGPVRDTVEEAVRDLAVMKSYLVLEKERMAAAARAQLDAPPQVDAHGNETEPLFEEVIDPSNFYNEQALQELDAWLLRAREGATKGEPLPLQRAAITITAAAPTATQHDDIDMDALFD